MSHREHDVFGVLVRRALVPVTVAGLAVSALAVLAGPRESLGALVGTGLVTVFFFTTLLLMRLTAAMPPRLTLGVALLAYWAKASALGMLLMASPLLTWFDPLWFGGVVVAGTLAWMVLHIRGLMSARIPLVEPVPALGRQRS